MEVDVVLVAEGGLVRLLLFEQEEAGMVNQVVEERIVIEHAEIVRVIEVLVVIQLCHEPVLLLAVLLIKHLQLPKYVIDALVVQHPDPLELTAWKNYFES